MQTHYLAGEAEAYACAFLLCGVERYEDLFLTFLADRASVVDDVDDNILCKVHLRHDLYGCRRGLDGILDKIDEDL